MNDSFASKVAELEHELSRVETNLHGEELEIARSLVSALLEVHRAALLDLRRVVGEAELARAAAAEPSLAWLFACHEIAGEELSRAVASAEETLARNEAKSALAREGVVPVARLLHKREDSVA